MTTYDLHDVPERGEARSRFALGTSPSGVLVRPPQGANLAYGRLLRARVAGLERLTPPAKTFRLKRIVRTVDGGYAVVECNRALQATPTHAAVRTGRFSKGRLTGGSLLDDLFKGGASWEQCHDEAIYEAARTHAEAEGAQGNDLRTLNELIQLAILARAGCPHVRSWDLPL